MISKEKPADFNKRFDIVGCFILCDGKFLLLHRHPHKASGDSWGLPAGKAEPGENLTEAVLREIKEETGIEVVRSDIHIFDSYFVRQGNFDFEWHAFSAELTVMPEVKISPHEHSEFRWVTQAGAEKMKLIPDLIESMEFFFSSRK